MNHSEDTGRTPGRAAWEAFEELILGGETDISPRDFAALPQVSRNAWEAAAHAAITAHASTGEDPQAELAAMHELLAAIVAAADVPLPASEGNTDDMNAFSQACRERLRYIHAIGRVTPFGDARSIRGRAQAITENAARPLPYQAEGQQP